MEISKAYEDALLAQMAYADKLNNSKSGSSLIDALMHPTYGAEGVTESQAKYFANKYEVIEQFSNDDTGFSATLFKDRGTGEYQLAVRGSISITESPLDPDWSSANLENLNYGISYNQVCDLINFYLRLTHDSTDEDVPQFTFENGAYEQFTSPPSQPHIRTGEIGTPPEIVYNTYVTFNEAPSGVGLDAISKNQELNLVGHSLGGHLASAFSLLFPSITNSASTFNSAGFIGDQFDQFSSLIAGVINQNGVLDLQPDSVANSTVNVVDIRSPKDYVSIPPIISTSHLGDGLIDVFIESDKGSHGIDGLVDSLAVINLLSKLDSSMTLDLANQLLESSSNTENTSLEEIMSHFSELFGQPSIDISDSNHNDVYSQITKITDELDTKAQYENIWINSLVVYDSANTIAQNAKSNSGFMYALEQLTPFVMMNAGSVYETHNENNQLDVENFSDSYLDDRATLLFWKMKYALSDTDYGEYISVDGIDGHFTYKDLGQGVDINIYEGVISPTGGYQQIVFGSDDNDLGAKALLGYGKDDRLYGRGGDDKLIGNGGDDYLEGGDGDDILQGGADADILHGGAGNDRLEAGKEDVYGSGVVNELHGEEGNDTLVGGDGIDYLFGGDGDDSLWVGRGGVDALQGEVIGTEYMAGGKGFDSYYISNASNLNVIVDSDGMGQIFARANEIGVQTHKLEGGGFWGQQITDKGLEADAYTQYHADGSSSNYTVAYELDGSQTLIVYGFNIPNFYNGMLGIKLEGGRVDTGNNVVEDVLDAIVFDDAFNDADKERIKTAIKNAYEQSSRARKMLRDYAVVGGNAININFSENGFASFGFERESLTDAAEHNGEQHDNPAISIDLNWLVNNTYISTNGIAVEDTLQTALIHELVHLMTGLSDEGNPGEKGEAIIFANSIYQEMGLPEQMSYNAYDSTGNTHVTNFDYTQGQTIDRAFTLHSENTTVDNFDGSSSGNLRDLIIGNERANTVVSGDGNDFLYGADGNDTLDGNDGDDTIFGDSGDDIIEGGKGNDHITGGIGNDMLNGGFGHNRYYFSRGDGQDIIGDEIIYSGGRKDELIFSDDINPEDVVLTHIDDDLVISFINTDDQITIDDFFANSGNMKQFEQITFANGTIWSNDYIQSFLLQGSNDDDHIVGDFNDNIINGLSGDDIIEGGFGYDTLVGGSGDDTLRGQHGNDILNGGLGNDTLVGKSGDDVLTGGLGNDIIEGGNGVNTINFSKGDGQDVISSERYWRYKNRFNRLVFSDDIVSSEVIMSRNNTDLVIKLNDSTDQITVAEYFRNPNTALETVLSEIVFADGTVLVAQDIQQLVIQGTDGDDKFLIGDVKNDVIDGGLGDDVIDGSSGDDSLSGGLGDDSLSGGLGDDSLSGGLGNDYITGGEGNDTYIYSYGDGRDVYRDWGYDIPSIDTLNFIDINSTDIHIRRDDEDLILTFNGNSDHIIVENQFKNSSYSDTQINFFSFADGVIWQTSDLLEQLLKGSAANDIIYGYDSADTINAGLGDDTVYGQLGNDIIHGDEGNDTLDGGEGDDQLFGDAGNDILYGSLGDDQLLGGAGDDVYVIYAGDGHDTLNVADGGQDSLYLQDINYAQLTFNQDNDDLLILIDDGTSQSIRITNHFLGGESALDYINTADGNWLSTNDINALIVIAPEPEANIITGTASGERLQGTENNDTLNGLAGDDKLSGQNGDDVLNGGQGDDVLNGGQGDDAYLYNLGDGNDVIKDKAGLDSLRFGVGITADNISVIANDTDMLITLSDGQVVTIANWYQSGSTRIEQFEFADGTVWAAADILTNMVIAGTDGIDTINNRLLVNGTTYDVGLGDDSVHGGKGDDTYLYNLGDGNDVIKDKAGLDSLRFGVGITADNISVIANDTDMLITLSDGQVVTIANWYQSGSTRIEQFEFADGTVWAAADILTNMVIAGTDGIDTINNKLLVNGTTYDVGLGDDIVYGGKGDDAYLYNLGDGNDVIEDKAGLDSLRFGVGITTDNISVSTTDTDMLITLSDGKQVTIVNWYQSGSTRIEQFEFADGTVWAATDILSRAQIDTSVTTVSDISSIDLSLNLLIQSYSSFDDTSDESGLEMLQHRNRIVLPVIENSI